MGLSIAKPEEPAVWIADRRLCLTSDKSEVVEANDSRAAYLLVGEGGEVLASEAEKYGLLLVDGKLLTFAQRAPAHEPEHNEGAAE